LFSFCYQGVAPLGLWLFCFYFVTKVSPRWGFGCFVSTFLPRCRPAGALAVLFLLFYQGVAPLGLFETSQS